MEKSNVIEKCINCKAVLTMKGEIRAKMCLSCILHPDRMNKRLKEYGFPEKIV